MPKATAVWLIKNTVLTFEQIADFCGMHALEVRAIADGEIASSIIGFDPVSSGQLAKEEIERCEKDPQEHLYIVQVNHPPEQVHDTHLKRTRYTPVSRRQDRPDAIAWLLKQYPELSDPQICQLIGTTKSTISSIRNKTHWKILNVTPRNPVTLGLCSQIHLEDALVKAQKIQQERDAKSAREKESSNDSAFENEIEV